MLSRASQVLFGVIAIGFAGCAKRSPDFERQLSSPSKSIVARFAGYQPRGTVEGYLTVEFSPSKAPADPQITVGHILKLRAGWVDDHTFALVYDTLEPRRLSSPLYLDGEASSQIELVTCNTRYLDCGPLLGRIDTNHTIKLDQFPEGTWPSLR